MIEDQKNYFREVIVSVSLAVFILSGCDKITSFFKKSEDQSPQNSVTRDQPPPESPIVKKDEPANKTLPAQVLAKVGDWMISVDQFNDRLKALKEAEPSYDIEDLNVKKFVLDQLVNQQLLVWGAERQGIAQEKDIRFAVEEFRRTLIAREVARRLTKDVSVTEEEAKALYEERKKEFMDPMQVRVREIIVDSKEKATNLLSELLKGSDFVEMAKQNSISKSAANGGDLGFLTQAPFPEMASALAPLEVGDLSSVFKGPQGYYIIKYEEKKEGKQIPFEEMKKDILDHLKGEKQEKILIDQVAQFKKEATIEVREELLESVQQKGPDKEKSAPPDKGK